MKIKDMLFPLLRCGLDGTPISEEVKNALSDEALSELFRMAKHHDVAHLVAAGLEKSQQTVTPEFRRELLKAAYRCNLLTAAQARLCQALEEAKLPFLPLKGAVMRTYYPEPWMRPSCDIDILVHPEDLERAEVWLTEHCDFCRNGGCGHDISLYNDQGVHLELHFALMEEARLDSADPVLRSVWQRAEPAPGREYHREMTDEMFYFYHIAHLAKHFIYGGCGIRALVDLWILDHRNQENAQAREELLRQGGLLTFANTVRQLSRVWLEGVPGDAVLEKTENYIFAGGVYGSMQNLVTVQQQKKGGPRQYALSRVFLPRESMELMFPVLKKRPWLLPAMHPVRWIRLVFAGRVRSSLRELRTNSQITREAALEMQTLLKDIGL